MSSSGALPAAIKMALNMATLNSGGCKRTASHPCLGSSRLESACPPSTSRYIALYSSTHSLSQEESARPYLGLAPNQS